MDVEEKTPTPAEEPFSSAASSPPSSRNWAPMIVGASLVIVAIVLVVIFARNEPISSRPDAYAPKLQVSNLHMETAQNFAGGTVTYIEGTLTNTGDRRVTGASMLPTFKNSLGEVVQNDPLPVMVVQPDAPVVDYGPMDRASLAPGQSRDFRLTLEHISTDWNGQIPEVKVVATNTN